MYQYKFNDLFFFIRSYKTPHMHSDVHQSVHFRSSSTRSSAASKLLHQASYSNTDHHFYFCRIARLWNASPQIGINLSLTAIINNYSLTHYIFGATFYTILTVPMFVLFLFVAMAVTKQMFPDLLPYFSCSYGFVI